ncbi:hypothetical protein [Sutcliffiella horikoshii]|uniref:hypothetical protein n=1 Tax=Sutcliffiella horikoshii TaxID=79883 RepID=UPI003CF1DAA6
MKYVKEYFPYIFLLTVIILNIIIFYALMETLNLVKSGITSALIGFLGSILGGVVTLIGVKWTIKASFEGINLSVDRQERQIFLDSYPRKLRLMHSINGKLNLLADNIMLNTDLKAPSKDIELIKNLISDLLDESSQVNDAVFSDIADLEPHITLYFIPDYKKLFKTDDDGFPTLIDTQKYVKLVNTNYKLVVDTIKKIDNHKVELQSNYRKVKYNINDIR